MGCQCSNLEKIYEARIEFCDSFQDIIRRQTEEYPVLLYSRSVCKTSMKVKELLRRNNIQFEYFEIDNMRKDREDEDSSILRALYTITGRRNPPFIFIQGKFIGGLEGIFYTEIRKYVNSV